MTGARNVVMLIVALMCGGQVLAQTDANKTSASEAAAPQQNPWDFNLSVSGYDVPHGESYVSPTLTADRDTIHLEARYNYEGLRTGSAWVGYNLSAGKKLTVEATPMVGGVFGNVTGIAPGVEFTATYKKVELFSANEYVFDTKTKAGNFFYTWTQLTYSPVHWFTAGYVTQRTRAYHTSVDIQRGLLVQFNYKKGTFSTQIFNPGETDPVVVFAVGYNFGLK
jgi:hypothetical protein